MAFFERYKSIYWRNVAIRFTLILVTVALIVFFMPRNRGVQLRYDIGKPCMARLLLSLTSPSIRRMKL